MPGQVTGTIGSEHVILTNAATESTLEMLVDAIEDMAKNLGAKGRNYKQEIKDIADESKSRKTSTKEIKDESIARHKYTEQVKKTTVEFAKIGVDLAANLSKVLFSTTAPTIQGFTHALGRSIPIVGPLIEVLGGIIGDNLSIYRQVSDVGANLGSSFMATTEAATSMGLSADILAKTLINHSKDLALLGGGAQAGAQLFKDVYAGLKEGGVTEKFQRLGWALDQLSDGTANYLALQTRLGRSQNMTNNQLIAGTSAYLTEIDEMTRITGLSRREAEQKRMADAMDAGFKFLYANMNEGVQNAWTTLSSAVGVAMGPEAEAGLREVGLTGNMAGKNAKIWFDIFGKAPELQSLIQEFARQTTDVEKANMLRSQIMAEMNKAGEAQKAALSSIGKTMGTITSITGNVYSASYAAGLGLANIGKQASQTVIDQKKAEEDRANMIALVDQKLLDIRNSLVNGILKVLGNINWEKIGNAIGEFGNNIIKFINIWKTEGFSKAFEQSEISKVFTTLASKFSEVIWDTITTGIKNWFLSDTSIISDEVDSTVYSYFDKIRNSIASVFSVDFAAEIGVYNYVKNFVSSIFSLDKIKDIGQSIYNTILSYISTISSTFTNSISNIKSLGESLYNKLLNSMNIISDTISSVATKLGPITDNFINLGKKLYEIVANAVSTWFSKLISTLSNFSFGNMFSGSESTSQPIFEKFYSRIHELALQMKNLKLDDFAMSDLNIKNLSTVSDVMSEIKSSIKTINTELTSLDSSNVINKLSDEFKKFTEEFSKATSSEGPLASPQQLLAEINNKLDAVNGSLSALITIEDNHYRTGQQIERHTKASRGNLLPG